MDSTVKRILSLDPGKTNMGISVVELHGRRPVCLANSTLDSPIKAFNDIRVDLNNFLSELDRWVVEFTPSALIAERFQSRGLRGNTGELVSIMLGAILVKYSNLPTKFITAATWKNPFQRVHGKLDEMYAYCKTTPHQLDASLIGVYGLNRIADIQYSPLSFIKNVESTSRRALINRK